MTYTPRPIDTSPIELPSDVLALAERLAENVHEIWAEQRLKDGWRWGPSRDDTQKQHPSLVPYQELPEIEKEYDRRVSLETLRAILAMGYRLQRTN